MKVPYIDWVAVPRSIAGDFRARKTTKDEWIIRSWIFQNANPYGIFVNCTYQLLADTFQWTVNKITKIMLSLQKKNLIEFPNHRGSRTPFDVKAIGFLTAQKTITKWKDNNSEGESRTEMETPVITTTELAPELESPEQNLDLQKSQAFLEQKWSMQNTFGRTPNNENENDKDNNKIDSTFNFSSKGKEEWKRGPKLYMPRSNEEELCRTIAINLEEESMLFLLSRLYNPKYGYSVIERAWIRYQETNHENIKNKRAYFNSLLDKIVQEMS